MQVAEEGGKAAEKEGCRLEGAQGAADQGPEDEAEEVSLPASITFPISACAVSFCRDCQIDVASEPVAAELCDLGGPLQQILHGASLPGMLELTGRSLLCRRNEALKTRAEGKIQKRKDKREKKLMRAGFEGRRDTPLGT